MIYLLLCLLLSGCQTVNCLYLEGKQLIEICDDNTTNVMDCSGEKCVRTKVERTEGMDIEFAMIHAIDRRD
jgi:hypothetical protein